MPRAWLVALPVFGWIGCSLADYQTNRDASSPDADTGATEAASDAGADVTPPPCDLTKPFQPPTLVAELDTAANEMAARLTDDELVVYFTRCPTLDAGVVGGAGGCDVFTASRGSTTSAFGTTTTLPFDGLNGEYDPSPTGDNLNLFLTITPQSGTNGDIYAATRSSVLASFGTPTALGTLDTTSEEYGPYTLPDGLTLYFDSSRDQGTNGHAFDLFRATRTTTTPFAIDPSNVLDALNQGLLQVSPVVTVDDRTLYFSTLSPSQDLDIWVATRASTTAQFGSPSAVTELDTNANEIPTWISRDGCRLYFSRGFRMNARDDDDIWVATKPP